MRRALWPRPLLTARPRLPRGERERLDSSARQRDACPVARAGRDREALARARRGEADSCARGGGVQAAARGLLCRVRLDQARDQAGGDRLAVRGLPRLGSAARRRQDDLPARPGVAHPRTRPQLPRHGRDPLRDLEPLGREHRIVLVHGRRDRPPADGRSRVRRDARRQLDAERAARPPFAEATATRGPTSGSSCAGSTTATAAGRRAAPSW